MVFIGIKIKATPDSQIRHSDHAIFLPRYHCIDRSDEKLLSTYTAVKERKRTSMQGPQDYEVASSNCSNSAEKTVLYLGHEKQYWGDMAINWMPFLLLCIFLFYLIAPSRGTNKKYRDLYEQSIETQKKAYEEMQLTTKLLTQILNKLDSK